MSHSVYRDVSEDAVASYHEFGFVHFRFEDPTYDADILGAYKRACELISDPRTPKKLLAYLSVDGSPKHVIDVLRTPSPVFRRVLLSQRLRSVYARLLDGRLIFTHAKISFKTPGGSANWYPHQDNGYKAMTGAALRTGFAALVCLEDMDELNGALQLAPRSQLHGTMKHTRVVEHEATGDYQIVLEDSSGLDFRAIAAKRGDVILFSSDTVHRSGNTTNQSQRICLIAEVEPAITLKLDDYSKAPVFALGKPSLTELARLKLKQYSNPAYYWSHFRGIRSLKLLLRRLRYGS